jgi:molecular chaperone DnaK (HSP70)
VRLHGAGPMTTKSRYCVGIDLGTTNSVIAYIDTLIADAGDECSRVFAVDQKVGPGSTQALEYIPSVLLYDPHEDGAWTVGRYASDQARYQPQRVVVSAKSWLSHSAVNREAAILPWGSTEVPVEDHVSPVRASALVLSAIRDAWNRAMSSGSADYCLEEQEVVITVPASFDEVAQELTVRAAHEIGLKRVRLLEEPQSAFYRWLEVPGATHSLNASVRLSSGQLVLVCDVGGGTTDLSLFEVSEGESALPRISRLDVSEHLLLGGDNIDATLAEQLALLVREKQGSDLSFSQKLALRAIAKDVKEQILSESTHAQDIIPVSVPGSGSSLFAGAISLEVSTARLRDIVMQGFFPFCSSTERPLLPRGGLRESGLPYVRDPRITVHLAGFLRGRPIGAILFNGGTLRDRSIRERVIQCVSSWQSDSVEELLNLELGSAVARGAAWYGFMQRQRADALIFAGYPRALYVELYREKRSEKPKLVCVVPKGFSGERSLVVESQALFALVERPVRFQIWSSLTRGDDAAGSVVSDADDVQPLASVVTKLSLPTGHALQAGARLPISLVARLTETGLLALECSGSVPLAGGGSHDVEWKLTFNVRREDEGSPPESQESEVSSAAVQRCTEVVDRYYGRRKAGDGEERPKGLFKALEDASRMKREDWSVPFMRSMWAACERGLTRRGRSLEHEVNWLNLAGFVLRPGFGAAMDAVRIDEAWRVQQTGLAFPKETASRAAACIYWRRIAAGLSAERQEILFRHYFPEVAKAPPYGSELVRMLASLERLGIEGKERLFRALVQIVSAKRGHAFGNAPSWALERLLARIPLCGELDTVVPAAAAESWVEVMLGDASGKLTPQELQGILLSVAARTGDPRRDIGVTLKDTILRKLRSIGTQASSIEALDSIVELEHKQVSRLLGENMPAGLVWGESREGAHT